MIKGKQIFVHRIIALLVFGELPKKAQVDHINHTRTDNRPVNLRIVAHSENTKNQSKQINNASGVCGGVFRQANEEIQSPDRVTGG